MWTTTYGHWNTLVDSSSMTVEQTVYQALIGADSDWLKRFEANGFDQAVADYRAAINESLPAGVALVGNEFIGPLHPDEDAWEGYPTKDGGVLDIAAIVEKLDVYEYVNRYDPDAVSE